MLKSLKKLKIIGYGMIVVGLIGSFSWGIREGIEINKIKTSLEEQIFSSEQYIENYNNEMTELDKLLANKEISKKIYKEKVADLKNVDIYINHLSESEKNQYKSELESYDNAKFNQNASLGLGATFVLPGLAFVTFAEAKKAFDDDVEVEKS